MDVGIYEKKIKDQAEQIKKLKAQVAGADEAIRQTSRALDAILAELAVKYGEKKGRTWTITIPAVSVFRNTRDYAVETAVGKDNETYVITARRRGKKNGTDSQ